MVTVVQIYKPLLESAFVLTGQGGLPAIALSEKRIFSNYLSKTNSKDFIK